MSERFYRCPVCGEYVPDHYGPPMMPGRGHYHDNPDNRIAKRIFHPAEEVEVVPAVDLRAVEAELENADKALNFALGRLDFVCAYDDMEEVGRIRRGAALPGLEEK